jgi:PAS domain S-box-containing protein
VPPRWRNSRWRRSSRPAVDAIIIIDQRGLIEQFNRSAERMFGFRAGEAIGL